MTVIYWHLKIKLIKLKIKNTIEINILAKQIRMPRKKIT